MRIILSIILCALAWHATTEQRQYAADLWRDVRYHIEASWPGIEQQ